jgi:hypothetical protein
MNWSLVVFFMSVIMDNNGFNLRGKFEGLLGVGMLIVIFVDVNEH